MTKPSKRKMGLGVKIFLGLVLGAVCGLLLGDKALVLKPFGDLFIQIIKIVVVPLVLASITAGVVSASDLNSLGRVGMKTVALFLGSTICAVIFGLIAAQIIGPGVGLRLSVDTTTFTPPALTSFSGMLLGLVPSNPFESLASGNVLQVIVFAILLGISILMAGDKGKPLGVFFESFSEVMVKLVGIIIQTAPYGVFCLIAPTTGKYGISVLLPLASVILALLLALAMQLLLVFVPLVKLAAHYPLRVFFKQTSEAVLMAFSSSMSAAALPFSMQAQQRLGVPQRIRGFVIPLGMTVNMNGTSLYLAIAATFVANVYGIDLSLQQMALIVITGVLASVGTAAVPMAGLVMLTMVLQAVGLPLEGLALVAGIDRILDMLRTSANVMGDNVVALAVAALEGELPPPSATGHPGPRPEPIDVDDVDIDVDIDVDETTSAGRPLAPAASPVR